MLKKIFKLKKKINKKI